ncbi:MAG: hypothetical protein V7638_3845 [Acidobacteriota bacterium]|jgi:hypothetical protein
MSETKDIKSLDDIRARERNPNRGTDRGRELTKASLRVLKAGRSVVVDRNGELIGGHTTTDAWRDVANPDDIIVVKSDGKKLVVVQRTDLDSDDRRTQMLAHVDNLTSHAGYNPDPDVVADIGSDLLDAGFLDQTEFDALYAQASDDYMSNPALDGNSAEALTSASGTTTTGAENDTSSQLGALTYRVIVDCRDEAHQAELLAAFELEGITCRPLIS